MTKLFSMKSLAFAGAAAFALTLAAAPQADAADATDITKIRVNGGAVTIYTNGELSSTEDGGVIYYQTAKSKDKIKEGKYTAISTHNCYGYGYSYGGYGYDYGDEGGSNSYSYNFGKFIGKETYISFSLDGAKEVTGVALKAQPKLKVKYTASEGYTFAINGSTYNKITTDASINSGRTRFVVGGDSKKYTVYSEGSSNPDWYLNFGGTVYWTAHELNSTDGVAVTSKAAKVKIAAQPKAPKASLKLDATKGFTWKISSKQEFKVEVDGVKSAWVDGSNAADDWAKIIGKAKADWADATKPVNIVSGDAITADINISLRTKADKKAASAINLIKLTKSAASPTSAAVEVKTTKQSGKTATGASIKAKADIQYSVDGGTKWSKLGKDKEAKIKDLSKTVLIRTPGVSKNATVLPSLNTQVTVNDQTGVATVSYIDYDADGAAKKITVDTVNPS